VKEMVWIRLSQDRYECWGVVSRGTNVRVPWSTDGGLTRGGIVSFSRMNMLHGVGRSFYRLVSQPVSQTFTQSLT
jgi:hypothetical protein